MEEMKYRELFFQLRGEMEETIAQLKRAVWEADKKLLDQSIEFSRKNRKK